MNQHLTDVFSGFFGTGCPCGLTETCSMLFRGLKNVGRLESSVIVCLRIKEETKKVDEVDERKKSS